METVQETSALKRKGLEKEVGGDELRKGRGGGVKEESNSLSKENLNATERSSLWS